MIPHVWPIQVCRYFQHPTLPTLKADHVLVQGRGNNEWEYGIPNASTIGSAHSPSHAWATNLNGNYQNSSVWITCIHPNLTFQALESIPWSSGIGLIQRSNNDGGALQYLNIQNNWVTLGSQNDPHATNWYNTFSSGQYRWSGNPVDGYYLPMIWVRWMTLDPSPSSGLPLHRIRAIMHMMDGP